MAIAADEMIVDHADRLHEGIDDGRPAKLETALRQFLGYCARDRGFGRHLTDAAKAIDLGTAVHEVPQQFGKARPLFHHLEPGARREHRAFDLGAVANDAGIAHQPFDLRASVARDLFRIEAVEGAAEILAFAQDRNPGQAGLETVEHELFVKRAIIIFGHAPFLIVIGDIERVLLGPRTAQEIVESLIVHSAALISPGNEKRAQSGLMRRMGMPPAASASGSASATRSRRISAMPRPRAAEPMVPTWRSPAVIGVPFSGAAPS